MRKVFCVAAIVVLTCIARNCVLAADKDVPAAKELEIETSGGSISKGQGNHSNSSGLDVPVVVVMTPTNRAFANSSCSVHARTNTAVHPLNPVTQKWDASGHASEEHVVKGELVSVKKDKDALWVFSPWIITSASVSVEGPSRSNLGLPYYKLDAAVKFSVKVFNPDGSIEQIDKEIKKKIYNISTDPHVRDVITSEEATQRGITATYILKPEDRLPNGNWAATAEASGLFTDQQLVFAPKIHFSYGAEVSMAQDAELFNIIMTTSAIYDGRQSTLDAFDLTDKANKDLKKLVDKLPTDPIERFTALLNAVAAAKVLKRTPKTASGAELDAHWALP